ncbi:cytochrome c oxidase subunit III [Nocardia brasiliensis NBRC 14402]|uniref:cytochrome c oxidase subunit 3 n=1 Tax=Nocardia brasiliensis TaxID=37326 RepID=UPI0002E43EBD|nr:cytochrome c oxidase subunit 3 [Nocardia brasiliensis]GAJ86584.1 cytochrome c oxidase subunit III [Nocardia brasiliensis NBRC 14402]
MFLFGDLVIFALFFGTIAFYHRARPEMFTAGQAHLSVGLGVLNIVVLLTGSLFVALGVQAARQGLPRAVGCLLLGVASGVAFAAVKTIEYTRAIRAGLLPTTDDFFMSYFVFTGIHLGHVLIGTALLAGLAYLARRPALTDGQLKFIEGGACFWHLVDLLWIALFALLYLV